MCAASRNEPCTIIGGGVDDDYQPTDDPKWATGAPRKYAHHNRGLIDGPLEPPEKFVAVKDEPNHYRDEPHTAQCEEHGCVFMTEKV